MSMILSQAVILKRRLKSLNKNLLSFFERVDLICISGTQIYRHYNLPIQSMKVNLLMPNKDLKRQPILKQYSEYPGLKIVTICLLV